MAGSIQKINDETYRFHYMFKGNRYSETIKATNVKADFKKDSNLQIALAKFIERIKKGNYYDTNYTFTEYSQIWLDNIARPNFSPSSVDKSILYLNNRILPYLGSYKITEISSLTLTNFFNDLKQQKTMYKNRENKLLSRGTISRIKDIVSSIFQNAYEMSIIPNNPCHRVKLKFNEINENFKNEEIIQYYDKETYKKAISLLKNESIEHRCIIEIALKTGLRRSEIYGLTWNDINFEKQTISVNKSRHKKKGGEMYTKDVKAKASKRTITIPNSLIELLKEYHQLNPNCTYLFDSISINGISKWFKSWQIKNNIPVIRFHDLRHTHATLLLLQGVDLKTIQHRLGHANITMTMNTYTHVLEELDKTASSKLDELL